MEENFVQVEPEMISDVVVEPMAAETPSTNTAIAKAGIGAGVIGILVGTVIGIVIGSVAERTKNNKKSKEVKSSASAEDILRETEIKEEN